MSVDGLSELNSFLNTYNAMLNTANSFASIMIEALKSSSDPIAKTIANEMKRGNACVVETKSYNEANHLQRVMKENGIDFAMAAKYRDHGYVVLPEKDRELAQRVVNQFYREQERGGLVSKGSLAEYSDMKVQEISGLDENTMMLYEHYSQAANIKIAIGGPENDLYKLYFAKDDSQAMDQIRANIAFDRSGELGKALQAQLEWENSYRATVFNAVLNGRTDDGQSLAVGSSIVDNAGKSIEIRKNSICFSDDRGERVIPKNANFDRIESEIKSFLVGMDSPVMLNPQQTKELHLTPLDERYDFLRDVERASGRPVLSNEQMQTIAQVEARRSVVCSQVSPGVDVTKEMAEDLYRERAAMWGLRSDETMLYNALYSQMSAEIPESNINIYDWILKDDISKDVSSETREHFVNMERFDTDAVVASWMAEDRIFGEMDQPFVEPEQTINVNPTRDYEYEMNFGGGDM